MMYNQKMVACLKANGKVLREFKDTIYIPFGSEYNILLKNLNSVRASVRAYVDGVDATDGVSLVVNPNSEFELSRFIKNGNLNIGNRFRFINRTTEIEQHKGIGVEDGLIRIEFQFEKIIPSIQPFWNHGSLGGNIGTLRSRSSDADGFRQCSATSAIVGGLSNNSGTYSAQSINYSTIVDDVGITVPGSISTQQFQPVSGFMLEPETHVIILKLLGETNQGQVIQPITVKTKPICTSCGTTNKAIAQFCYKCGTALMFL